MTEQLIDWDHIDRLRQEVGAEGFREIVGLFHTEVADVFARIRIHGPNHTDMHFLKGSAANLGFIDFSKVCQIGEHALREGDSPFDLKSVLTSYETSCQRFASGLPDHPS